jgi:hypothetical protein
MDRTANGMNPANALLSQRRDKLTESQHNQLFSRIHNDESKEKHKAKCEHGDKDDKEQLKSSLVLPDFILFSGFHKYSFQEV